MKIVHVDNEEGLNEYNDVYDKKCNIFVFFYMPTCYYCNLMEPEWEELEKEMEKKHGKEDVLAKVRGDYTSKVNGSYDVKGFPTIYYTKKGKDNVEYSGNRTKDDLDTFIRSHLTETTQGGRPPRRRRQTRGRKSKKNKSRRRSTTSRRRGRPTSSRRRQRSRRTT